MGEPTQADIETTARARQEIKAITEIVDALEPFAADNRERVLAAAAILSGVAPLDAVRTLLRSI